MPLRDLVPARRAFGPLRDARCTAQHGLAFMRAPGLRKLAHARAFPCSPARCSPRKKGPPLEPILSCGNPSALACAMVQAFGRSRKPPLALPLRALRALLASMPGPRWAGSAVAWVAAMDHQWAHGTQTVRRHSTRWPMKDEGHTSTGYRYLLCGCEWCSRRKSEVARSFVQRVHVAVPLPIAHWQLREPKLVELRPLQCRCAG